MQVEVTQFMRPDGRQVAHQLTIKDDCEASYKAILSVGARLTAEQLMNGTVSQTIETNEGDFDITLTGGSDFTKNKEALEEMILRFDKDEFVKWDKGMREAS